MSDSPDYIDGISNYCDRWCERCPFTRRCRSFSFEVKIKAKLEKGDDFNQAFWEAFEETTDNFENPTGGLTGDFELEEAEDDELAAILGEYSSEIDEFGEGVDQELKRKSLKNHPISIRSRAYAFDIDKFQKKCEFISFNEDGSVTIAASQEGVEIDSHERKVSLEDAFEAIWFYHLFIHVKLTRAFQGRVLYDYEEDDGFPKDSDGSAKVALIAIDRSIAAWKSMHSCLHHKRNDIAQYILTLTIIRKQVEEFFPDARAFVRPGFDTEK
ncbi:MAG: hypothetical protein GF398_02225 [Chitinivibrionales bacterium]|nr:hypothetical protein [Chitinivibrionales bacterium]